MMIAFTLSGALAGPAAERCCQSVSAARRRSGSIRFLLSAATTCLMGGIALEGGIGNVIGIAIGLFTLLRFLVTGMAALGAPYYVQRSRCWRALDLLVVVVQLMLTRLRKAPGARTQLSVRIA